MHPATAISLSKAMQAAHRREAEHRRLRAQAARRRSSEQAAHRAWPLRLLRLGNAGSRA